MPDSLGHIQITVQPSLCHDPEGVGLEVGGGTFLEAIPSQEQLEIIWKCHLKLNDAQTYVSLAWIPKIPRAPTPTDKEGKYDGGGKSRWKKKELRADCC